MDACRTAVRLGAKEVYNIYRRTKDEMPADHLEILEAEEEGVIFKNLTNPIEVISDENGHVKEVLLQVMELGEPDASGRRKPVPVEGKTELLPVDTVILAIGQAVDSSLFPGEKTKKNAIAYNPNTFMTSIPGVFAGGDCGNDKISIAIESIADARKASEVIDAYLHGEIIQKRKDFVVERHDLSARSFEERDNMFRQALSHLSAEERKDNFTEVIPNAYTEEEAREEASRCLECGCHDYYECKLIDFARQYQVQPARFAGEKNCIEFEDNHPFIVRDPNKCILCGLCVRVCDEVVGVGALGLINRGFDTVVKPNMGKPLAESGCISCGQCVSVCPVGALQERTRMVKETPLKTTSTKTTCSYCSAGCIFPVAETAALLRERKSRALLHCDAVQGFMKVPCDPVGWGVDMMSFSAHKIGGPKGIGALYIAPHLRNPRPLLPGGGQEFALRSGTEATAQIAGFAKAVELRTANYDQIIAQLTELKAYCREKLSQIPTLVEIGKGEAPHILAISLPGYPSANVVTELGEQGICISAGSACHKGKSSHVVSALGLDKRTAAGVLRLSFGPENTREDIDAVCDALQRHKEQRFAML